MKYPLNKAVATAFVFLCGASLSNATIVTDLTQTPGLGSEIDLTAATYIGWGYATAALNSGFDNFQSGTTVPAITNTTSANTRDWGYTFTFNDGNSPATGTTVASSGGQAGLLNSGPHLTFSGIVSSSETRRLTLYVGGYATTSVDATFNATLTGGSSDESGLAQTLFVNSGTTSASHNVGVYTIEFTSATETDLLIEIDYTNASGTRQFGISGYTLEVVPIPEPSAYGLLAGALGLGCVIYRRRLS